MLLDLNQINYNLINFKYELNEKKLTTITSTHITWPPLKYHALGFLKGKDLWGFGKTYGGKSWTSSQGRWIA